jgi:hypothetical protein
LVQWFGKTNAIFTPTTDCVYYGTDILPVERFKNFLNGSYKPNKGVGFTESCFLMQNSQASAKVGGLGKILKFT